MKNPLQLTILLLLSSFAVSGQSFTGLVADSAGKPLPFATVALLHPADTTLAFFGISDDKGRYEVKKVKPGNYLLQVSFMGFNTFWKHLNIQTLPRNYGIIVLIPKPLDLPETEIESERIPLSIRKDTIVYNAGAFKTKPDAVAEDLLKKLPGIEVDQSGNIKAMGEDVKNVMVDGKEFFSSDPKVATRNLPADAIEKVQVYDKKSEASELAGIDDAEREKTINLMLAEGKKQAWLGEFAGGGGTGDHYDLSGKTYRFTAKNQFALLGMVNNINKFGFSFRDYIDFTGGIQNMMSGGGLKISIGHDSDMPLNFGQTIEGLVTSGAGGLNYSFERVKNRRFFASYLGNGSAKDLTKQVSTRNYLPAGEYRQEEELNNKSTNFAHKLTLGFKEKSDSTKTITMDASAGIVNVSQKINALSEAIAANDAVNILKTASDVNRDDLTAGGSLNAMYRGRGAFRLFNFRLNGSVKSSLTGNNRHDINTVPGFPGAIDFTSFRSTGNTGFSSGAGAGVLIGLQKGWYLNPKFKADYSNNTYNRTLKNEEDSQQQIDSLSPDFQRTYLHLTPSLALKYNTKKSKLTLGIELLSALTRNSMPDSSGFNRNYSKALPFLSWEYDIRTGHRVALDYNIQVNEPDISLLVPVADNSDPQSLFYGNRYLLPETTQNLFMSWMLYDQFSQTSIFSRIGGSYTNDKINFSRTTSSQLVNVTRMVNTGNAYDAIADLEFSTPLRWAGVNMRLELSGNYSQSEVLINGQSTVNQRVGRTIGLSFNNRKTEKWNLETGGEVTITNAFINIEGSNNTSYLSSAWFANLGYNTGNRWFFNVNSNITNYNPQGFSTSFTIPILSAETGYHLFKNKRGTVLLSAYDLLDKNKGITRISEFNYLRETRSNIIKRYIMLTFKYRLNKTAGRDVIDVQIK